ncbi:MAG: methyltransferase domain-containing protein, partial [Candidatus Gastranaerophilales bacterium]|nr:methyltransferase domain-containing protein [Candidatus Gastranaerophilales bacterium]
MNFENAKNSYRKNAIIQKQMAKTLVMLLIKNCGTGYSNIFEIGSGTGFLTDEIKNTLNFEEITLNDINDNYTGFEPYEYLKGDIEKIPILKKFDLIISNAVFQWLNDYESLFKKLYLALKDNGKLVFSAFGSKNFIQIKDITGIGLDYP